MSSPMVGEQARPGHAQLGMAWNSMKSHENNNRHNGRWQWEAWHFEPNSQIDNVG